MPEPLTIEERAFGRRLTAHLDAIPLDDPKVIVRSVVTAPEAERSRSRSGTWLLLIAAALAVGGVGAIASGAVRLDVIPDTVVLPPEQSLPAPPVVTPTPTRSNLAEASPSNPQPAEVANGDVLISYGGRVFLTDPTGDTDPFELPGPDGPDWAAQWSPDGRRILVLNGKTDGDPDHALWLMRPDGRGTEQLTGTTSVPLRHVQDPVWSPDGTRVAMRAELDREIGIYVLEIAARSISASTTDAGMAGGPAWSPDGTRIAFHLAEGRIGVWTIGDASPTVVVDTATVSEPTWGRDRSIVFTEFVASDGGQYTGVLVEIQPDGTGRHQLTSPGIGRQDAEPHLSPDGATLAFLRTDPNGGSDPAVCCGTILRSFETGTERLLGEYPDGAWSPDGRWIASSSIDPAVAPADVASTKTEWVAVRVADGAERLLLVRNASSGPAIGPQVSWGAQPSP